MSEASDDRSESADDEDHYAVAGPFSLRINDTRHYEWTAEDGWKVVTRPACGRPDTRRTRSHRMTHGLNPDRDAMQDDWCCLTCYARFKFGKLRVKETGMACPTCGSFETAAADGRVYTDLAAPGAIT